MIHLTDSEKQQKMCKKNEFCRLERLFICVFQCNSKCE